MALALCFADGHAAWAQEVNQQGAFYNVRNFGARGDGVTLETDSISKAIRTANAAGGGTVVFPPGVYLSGTVELLSNVTLEVQAGAVLQGSRRVTDYGGIAEYGFGQKYGLDSTGEGTRVGLIVARNADNVGIVGRGVIDGNGDSFFDLKSHHDGSDFDPKYTRQGADFDAPKYGLEFGPAESKPDRRPGTMLIFSHCRNVLVRDITLKDAPNWTMHLQSSEQARITGIHISNNVLLPNNDGIDLMACKHVQVADCDIRAGDDDFAIVGCEDLNINNCSLFSYSAAIRLEDTRYSTLSNFSIHANRGLGIFSRGEEHTAHVLFSNITMETMLITGHWWGKGEPIYIAARTGEGKGEIRDVHFTNIAAEAEGGMVVYGSPDCVISELYLEQIRMHVRAPQERIAQSVGGNFDLRWTATQHSEAIFKHDIPALYVRYADGLRIRDFDLSWDAHLPSYFSSAFEAENTRHVSMADFKLISPSGAIARPLPVQ